MQNSPYFSQFPAIRLRRLRASPWIRELVQETRISVTDLIWPIFILEGSGNREDVSSMPGVQRLSVDLAIEAIKEVRDLGIPAVALFPITPSAKKTPDGREACNSENLICRAVYAIKKNVPEIGVITDVALDPYTSHGHDGLLKGDVVLNDDTVEVLCRQAVVQAQAGADVIAPSDMMDGRIGAIRAALDKAGYPDTIILSYAAKYASAFYGPFRDAVQSAGCLSGDKKTYQMNPGNTNEAIREVALDLAEGADMVMVKPGLPYLDIIRRVKDAFSVPTFAYHVSGEYAMLRAASEEGWLDYASTLMESLSAFKRAGADGIFTYGAVDAARLLNKSE
ncbi:MAG: porphobilinogen synthase [Rhodospirillales bacterium]|nr:porphobilinogen synthase [Alphaproteobacteria bacterium]MCB9976025.1 porphobilinogen synthase [Rhodospirillales bacterium]